MRKATPPRCGSSWKRPWRSVSALPSTLWFAFASDWEGCVTANPFAGDAKVLAKMVHLYLSRDPVKSSAAKELDQKAQAGERIVLAGNALWIDYGATGVGRSKLSPLLIDKACGSPTTGRNWNSVMKIREMIAARG